MFVGRTTAAACVVCALGVAIGAAGQEPIPPALAALADTEREFARAARAKGIRDSFLAFFADDALAFTPDPTSAKARLLSQKPRPFAVHELTWEPRTGDVAASGDLGWLTGPSIFINHERTGATPQHGNYLSVWRRQGDGPWRVLIDVGTGLKAEATFAPGFTRLPFADRYTGTDGKASAAQSLREADRRLNARVATDGAVRGYADYLTAATRLHRPDGPPAVGSQAIAAWLERQAVGLSATSGAGESSAAGDLGYTYGMYEVKSPRADSGAYVRIWTRDAAGRWFVVADVTQPAPPPR